MPDGRGLNEYFQRGHLVVRDPTTHTWRYLDDWTPAPHSSGRDRACILCGRMANEDGHDACIENLPGIASGCCGHGVTLGYLFFLDHRRLRLARLNQDPFLDQKYRPVLLWDAGMRQGRLF